MSDKPKPQWSRIRKQLLLLDHNELIGQIKDLYALSGENRRFLESRFSVEAEQVEAILAEYKQEIEYCFFGKRDIPDESPRLRDARSLIREYRKATKDTQGTLDLMLHYVETGTELTNTYGDIDAPFYNSLESMLTEFCEGIFKSSDPKQAYNQFYNRLDDLKNAVSDIGWGYSDEVWEILVDLESRFEER
jgi:hypothetical protein